MKKQLYIAVATIALAGFTFAQGPTPGLGNSTNTVVQGPATSGPAGANGGAGAANGNGYTNSYNSAAQLAGGNLATGQASGTTYSGNVIGNTAYIPNYDVMGAHENGGRGCAGCHAPHNGAMGNGGNKLGGYGSLATQQGGLWGEDTTNIIALGTITFNGGLSHHSGVLTFNGANNWSDPNYTGVATCLSCHDGNVAEGAMMSGYSYEQMFGLLNGVAGGASGVSANRASGLTTQLYGNNPIPTLLGGGTGAGYGDTHPVGQTANMGAVLGSVLTSATYGLSPAVTGSSLNVAALTPNSPYANFVASYYPTALAATVNATTGVFASNYVTCTTCHNQHNMAVYAGTRGGGGLPVGVTQVRTIFFVNGAYNPGAPYDPTHEPSTMRFCQQCHFSMSSEYFGATNVGTAY